MAAVSGQQTGDSLGFSDLIGVVIFVIINHKSMKKFKFQILYFILNSNCILHYSIFMECPHTYNCVSQHSINVLQGIYRNDVVSRYILFAKFEKIPYLKRLTAIEQ